jgi:polyisoprenoid-binding protein YceI
MGLIPVSGVFGELSGVGRISPDGQVSGTLTVSTASINTRNTRRDEHLRSADFFDSGTHPTITFTADRIEPAGQVVAVSGTLTVRGQSRPVRFAAVPSVTGDDEIRLAAEVQVNRADFGLTWNAMGLTSMNNSIEIQASFNRG